MDLREQIKWETDMLNFGVARFRNQQTKAIERKQYTQTSAGARLLKSYLSQVSEFISHYIAGNQPAGRRRNKFTNLIATVDADKLALFALTRIIQAVYQDTAMAKVIQLIGNMVEDELRFTKLELEKPEWFSATQRAMDNRNSSNYGYRKNVLVHGMYSNGVEWEKWDHSTTYGVGALVFSLAMDASDLIQKVTETYRGKSKTVLVATQEVDHWIRTSDEAIAVMLPDRMPCLVPPADWEDHETGGYYSPRLRMLTSLVKTRIGFEGKEHGELIKNAPMLQVRKAVNAMQKTAWCINAPVLEAMQKIWENNLQVGMPPTEPYVLPKAPVPKDLAKSDMSKYQVEALDNWKEEAREIHALEKKRKGNVLSVARTMRIGEMLKSKQQFFYVYQTDFRGRIYSATSGVSPQGSDHAKAVLHFVDGKPIGKKGFYWLKVHGANKYGEDKGSYDMRVAWIDERKDNWVAVAKDPVANRDYWKDADKPYQFLAFCIEYCKVIENGISYPSTLPIALDGSCNGLQHFSAMLRDRVGGRSVNLCPGEEPADIYQEVGNVCWAKLNKLAQENTGEGVAAVNWIDALKSKGYDTVPRKLSKKPVMTLPYGSTQQACTSSVFEWCIDNRVDNFPKNTQFKHCVLLSKLLWASIGEVVISSRSAMKWIQDSSSIISGTGTPLMYYSPLGFPVYQGSRKKIQNRIVARIGGSQLGIKIVSNTDEIDVRKQRQGSSPNLIHHVDATHLMMCVNEGYSRGMTSFAMIHDDFGVHACHIDEWHKVIREQFVRLHTEFDILRDFKNSQEELAGIELMDLPELGDLDIYGVLDSPYFFG